tara:strand:+ start:1210 stop:2223 length:1014 start_codon:yes stop_codon:yes gene_type:complete
MKILYNPLMPSDINQAGMVSDYQADMVFHGLVKRLGKDVHTFFDMWWHQKKIKEDRPKLFSKIWGKGFTMYGLLDEQDYTVLDRNENIGEYDAVVVPIHHTMTRQDEHLKSIIDFFVDRGYGRNRIIVVDGWDRDYICEDAANKCTYYKREMLDSQEEIASPISFAFPEEKIRELDDSNRSVPFAPLVPVNQSIDPSYMSTYIYEEEESYYDMYQTAYFSYTSKKGGWDTLRHYEIIANGSIPFFVDIENCPKNTLWNLPKEKLIEAKNTLGGIPNLKEGEWTNEPLPHCGVIEKENPGKLENFNLEKWTEYRKFFYDWLKEKNTTTALADYILGRI